MPFRFRKSKSLFVGLFRINFSKTGIGYSFGSKWLRYTKRADGKDMVTANIPRTGISWQKVSSNKSKKLGKKLFREINEATANIEDGLANIEKAVQDGEATVKGKVEVLGNIAIEGEEIDWSKYSDIGFFYKQIKSGGVVQLYVVFKNKQEMSQFIKRHKDWKKVMTISTKFWSAKKCGEDPVFNVEEFDRDVANL